MNRRAVLSALCGTFVVLGSGFVFPAERVSGADALRVPAFTLPPSSLASKEAADYARLLDGSGGAGGGLLTVRARLDAHLFRPLVEKQRARYAVDIKPQRMAGVYTEVFTPKEGIPPENQQLVLINLHGGAFFAGARTGGQVESLPIASIARIKVVSVDYRQAPEFSFPAGTKDVVAVYKELLKRYRPENIGIYGTSAGGMLTAQAVAWLHGQKLPLPGAIGMFFATGELWAIGDSAYIVSALGGFTPANAEITQSSITYLKKADGRSALVFPMRHPEVLKVFPPSLLITGSRAGEMSSITDASIKLTKAGVDTRLYIWDGLKHAFIYDPDLPESRDAYRIIADFFRSHLQKK